MPNEPLYTNGEALANPQKINNDEQTCTYSGVRGSPHQCLLVGQPTRLGASVLFFLSFSINLLHRFGLQCVGTDTLFGKLWH